MKRAEVLREQAALLRNLAGSFDIPSIKEDLLNLADRCDRLAIVVARQLSDRQQQPIDQIGKKISPSA